MVGRALVIEPAQQPRAVDPGVFTMRTLALAGLTMVTVLGGGAADAQRIGYPGAQYPVPGTYPVQRGGPVTLPAPAVQPYPDRSYPQTGAARSATRWGGSVGGRWYGGTYAPGGWNAYRRASRGGQLPSYWISPNFAVSDYASYGLSAPPRGYRWQRYYDDAVLLDDRDRVYDSRGGIDWDGGDAYARGGAVGYSGASDYGYGYSEETHSDGYAAPLPQYAPQPSYRPPYQPLPPVVQQGGVTTYQSSGGYASGYAGGYGATYGAPGTTTTVVTIQPTETLTTTTTEYVEETHAATRRVYRAPRKHYRVVRRACGCGCCR